MNYRVKSLLLLTLLALALAPADAQRRSKAKKKAKPVAKTTKKTTAPKTVSKETAKPRVAETTDTQLRDGLGDTTAPRVVTVTSAFKPSLRSAAKINFTAASPLVDTSRTAVLYQIPSQNLLFSYQPVPIKPLALPVDTGYNWQNDHFVKFGLGNFNSVLGEAAFSFGDGIKNTTIVHGNFETAKGDLFAQQYGNLGLDITSVFNTANHNEWTAKAWYKNTTRYFYGFEPSTISFTKDDILQRFNNVGIELGLRNKAANAFRITYAPKVNLRYFSDNRQNKEVQAILDAPLRKQFGDHMAIDLGIMADLSNTSIHLIPNSLSLKNNLIYVSPSVQYNSGAFRLNLGIRPSWDNGSFATLPNISAEARIGDAGVVAEAGWIGSYQKNTYRTLTDYNPWVGAPVGLLNTKVNEQYAGLRGSAGNHFTYQARLSFLRLNNQPLFPNSGGDGKSFSVVYEPSMDIVQVHGEVGYTLQEKLSLLAGITYKQFTSLQQYEKAWGIPPLEVTGTLRWKLLKDLQLKADAFVWDGSHYRDRTGTTRKLDPAADINLGAEFSVMPKLNLWVQLNNVLNNKYRRWNQYEVMGLNVLGGIVYSFR